MVVKVGCSIQKQKGPTVIAINAVVKDLSAAYVIILAE